MKTLRPAGLIVTFLGLLVASTLSYETLADPPADEGPEFVFRDAKGGERVVPASQLYFHIHTEPSRWSRYSRRSVLDPKTSRRVKFTDMASFTVKSGPDGHTVTFRMPGSEEARTLTFDDSDDFLGEEFLPRMLIKRRGQALVNHEYIRLEDIEWPIEVRR